MGWIGSVLGAILAVLKAVFGTDQPAKTTVARPEKDVEVSDDGKTDADRLRDLGL